MVIRPASGRWLALPFTDVVAPGTLKGPELARKARERIAKLAVLFTSGYADNAIAHDGRIEDGVECSVPTRAKSSRERFAAY